MLKRSVYQAIVVGLLFVLNIGHIDSTTVVNAVKKSKLSIGVIGAGPAGLVSAKHSVAHGHDVTVYEQGDEIGGVWVRGMFSTNGNFTKIIVEHFE